MRFRNYGAVFAALLILSAGGCALFGRSYYQEPSKGSSLLTPLSAPREAIDLEVYFVDRRIGDPLIGASLWDSLYAISSVSPEVRQQLDTDGFRFALSASRPPQSLQALMNLSNSSDPSRRALMQRYTLPSGQETVLLASTLAQGTPLTYATEDGVRTTELNNAQCILRVRAERIEDGWAKLVIHPEIRHGATTLRPRATDQEWMYSVGQSEIHFYQDRLSADLNEGEIVVLGLDPDTPDALASHFFRSDVAKGIERLILIRVANMRTVDAVRDDSHRSAR